MNEKIIDLHVHTNFSDGQDSIEEVIEKAQKNNIGAISLTEHYNISSYEIAKTLAGDSMIVIPGIEIGADMTSYGQKRKHICHILAYYISYDIYSLLDEYEIERYECVKKTLKLLRGQGIKITIKDVLKYSRDSTSIGRFDIAIALKMMGYTKSTNEAYGRYLDHNGSSYVQRQKLSPCNLVKEIIGFGGVPVLAHPRSLRMDEEQEYTFIKSLIDVGLGGIEVYNPNNGIKKRERYLNICDEFSLVPTVGSDYHGGNRSPKIEIGKGKNENLLISDMSIIEKLMRKKEEIDKKLIV